MTFAADYSRIRRYWVGLSLAQSVVLAYLGDYVLFSGYLRGTAFRLLAVGVVVMALGVIAFTLWLRPSRLEALRRRVCPWHGVMLVGSVGLALFIGAGSHPEWFYALVMLDVSATLALLYATLYADEMCRYHVRRWVGVGVVSVVGLLAFRVYVLSIYPPLHFADEPWVFGMALSYARTGHLFDWIAVDRPMTVVRFYALMGAWLRLVGEGFWRARLLTFGLSLGVVFFSAKAARNLYDRTTAFFTAAALLASMILAGGAQIRSDIGLALAVALSLWLYSEALKRDKDVLHLLAGAMIGIGYLAHYHAAIFGPALLVGLYLPRYWARRRNGQRWPERGMWLYGLGGLLAGVVAVVLQPFSQEALLTAESSLLTGKMFLQSTRQNILNITYFSQFEFLLIVLGVGAALWRRRPADLALVASLGLAHLALGVTTYLRVLGSYLIPLTPFYGILIGSLLSRGWSRDEVTHSVPLRRVAVVTGLLFLLPNLGLILSSPLSTLAQTHSPRLAPPPGTQWVLDHIEPEQKVVANHAYFLWLTDYRFISPLAPRLMSEEDRARYSSAAEAWDDIAPDVFIISDRGLSHLTLQPLLDEGYFAQRGYEVAFQEGTVTIYVRAP